MTLPNVGRILQLPELRRGNPEVVAGRDGLIRPVRWVHVSELTDIAHLLTGGELLLTTGIALESSDRSLTAYLQSLVGAGAAGLVIEAGRKFDRVPAALVASGNRLEFPVVLLRLEVKFSQVTQEAHAYIIDSQVDELRVRESIHDAFTEMALEGSPAEDIVRRAAVMSEHPVLLSTRWHQVIAFETGPVPAPKVLDNWDRICRQLPISGATRLVPGDPSWLVVPVGARGEIWGCLALMAGSDPPSARAAIVLERAAVGLALNRLAERDRETLELQAHRSLLADVRSGAHTPSALATRARGLGFETAGRVLVAGCVRAGLVDLPPGVGAEARSRELGHHVSAVCREQRLPTLTGSLPSGVIGLLTSFSAVAEVPSGLDRLARAIHAGVVARSEPDVVVTFGSAVDALREARWSLQEAEQVMESLGDDTGKLYYRMPDLHLRGLLHLLRNDERLQRFRERELGALEAPPRRDAAVLRQTLAVFLEQAGNKTSTATELGVSRPTLYSRLARLETILEVDLRSASSRLSLHVALLANEEARGAGS